MHPELLFLAWHGQRHQSSHPDLPQVPRRKKHNPTGPALLSPLPQCTEPNQRIHADLFGPLRVSGHSKKFILCMTDAFTKYVELVALPNKESETVANAIFEKWICRHGCPLEVVTDQGKEFCGHLAEDLFKLLAEHYNSTPSAVQQPR